jgi:hypothetical protein
MALKEFSVNLWKTEEVSYLQTLSNSTSTRLLYSVDRREEAATNMVLDSMSAQTPLLNF